MAKETNKEAKAKVARKASLKKPKSNHSVFKVTLTVAYNNTTVSENDIADSLWLAMSKVKGSPALMTVDSVRKSSKPDEVIVEMLKGISEKSTESPDSLGRGKTDDGNDFITVK